MRTCFLKIDDLFLDEPRKGWALRCLREAKTELEVARDAPLPIAIEAALSAMKKAQRAVYHGLGYPALIEPRVFEAIARRERAQDRVSRILVSLEEIFRTASSRAATTLSEGTVSHADKEAIIRDAEFVIELASGIVDMLLKELA